MIYICAVAVVVIENFNTHFFLQLKIWCFVKIKIKKTLISEL